MTIQRQYSLPNCRLTVQGFADEATGTAARPVLSRVLSVECSFLGQDTPLRGDRAFLENLSTAVSEYAQEFLSGIPHTHGTQSGPVQIQKVGPNLHRITVNSEAATTNGVQIAAPVSVDLKTVQLFDLVDAIDQLAADAQTLPDLSLKLAPLPKRHVGSTEPIAKRVVPAAIGVSSLAVAAIALFALPIPERRPEPTAESSPPPVTVTATPGASPLPGTSPTPAASPTAASPTPAASLTTSPSPVAATSPAPVAAATPGDSQQLDRILENTPAITDVPTLRQLNQQLRSKLDAAWDTRPTFDENLVYRVGVARNGDILGFRYGNDAALKYVKETPLLDLRYNPIEGNRSQPEAIAQFRVVFQPNGVLEVSPWDGYPQASPSP